MAKVSAHSHLPSIWTVWCHSQRGAQAPLLNKSQGLLEDMKFLVKDLLTTTITLHHNFILSNYRLSPGCFKLFISTNCPSLRFLV